MEREEITRILAAHRKELEALGVRSLALFGSVVRGEAKPDSDVDILVEFSKPVGLFAFLEVKERLERLLGRRVDLVTRNALHPRLRDSILKEAVHAG